MSDEEKSENSIPTTESTTQAQELSNSDLDKAVGGAVPGESTDDKHRDWIEILSYTQTTTQKG